MGALTAERIVVREATDEDAPAISGLVLDYFSRRCAPPQFTQGAQWVVAQEGGVVRAAQAMIDNPGTAQRWVMNTHCEPTRLGRLALKALVEYNHDRADAERVTLLGVTEEDNPANRAVMEARGWKPVGVLLMRPPKEA